MNISGIFYTYMKATKVEVIKRKSGYIKTLSINNNLNHLYRIRSCRAVNILLLGCKEQSVNDVQENKCSLFWETHKYINTLCGQNAEFLNIKPGGKYSNNQGSKDWL
jgi:hypothetical protein